MKPSWDQAPEWANYLAKDSNGQWAWHEEQPVIVGNDSLTHWNSNGRKLYTSTGWTFTLESRK